MRKAIFAFALLAAVASTAPAQSPGTDLAAGDREYRAMRAEEALAAYERALAADPDSYEALWKASRSALDLASGPVSSNDRRAQLFRTGERYARRAVGVRPEDAINPGHSGCHHVLGVWNDYNDERYKAQADAGLRALP